MATPTKPQPKETSCNPQSSIPNLRSTIPNLQSPNSPSAGRDTIRQNAAKRGENSCARVKTTAATPLTHKNKRPNINPTMHKSNPTNPQRPLATSTTPSRHPHSYPRHSRTLPRHSREGGNPIPPRHSRTLPRHSREGGNPIPPRHSRTLPRHSREGGNPIPHAPQLP